MTSRVARRAAVPALAALTVLLALGGCALISAPPPPVPQDQVDDQPTGEITEAPPVEAPPADVPASHLPGATPVDVSAYVISGFGDGPEFVSPSGNLLCRIQSASTSTASCVANEHSWEYPPCTDEVCSAYTGITPEGEVAVFRRGGAEFANEVGYGAAVLAYGRSIAFAGVTCVSTEDGMVCEDDTTRHGFLMSRSEHTWF